MAPRRTQVSRQDDGRTRWELRRCDPDPRLRPYVREYVGYVEHSEAHTRRRAALDLQGFQWHFGTYLPEPGR